MFEIYGRNNCIWCERAKALLEVNGLPYIYLNIEEDKDALDIFKDYFPSAKTVPQILVEVDKSSWDVVGTFEDLRNYLKDGKQLKLF